MAKDDKQKHLKVELLDVDRFVKVNNLKEVTNPTFFVRDGIPTSDGLLSNEIFGITRDDRANTFAYIDLHDWFINPLVYRTWCALDRKIIDLVHGLKKFSIDENGYLVEDENGGTGISFLKKNIDIIKIKPRESNKVNTKIQFIYANKKRMFVNKYIVIPAFYRDVNSTDGRVGVGDINKLYAQLLIAVRGLKETFDYGLNLSESMKARVQETITSIYEWFGSEPQLPKKKGLIKRSILSKSADYGARLVISPSKLRVDKMEDMKLDVEHCALPLAAACTNLFPYVLFYLRKIFENYLSDIDSFSSYDKNNQKRVIAKIKDPQIQFSDDVLKHQIKRFMKGFSNRFEPVIIELENGKKTSPRFKGTLGDGVDEKYKESYSITNRRLTWCDLLFLACNEAAEGKMALVTRYPIDTYFNQFPQKIIISSTLETVPMNITLFDNTKLYTNYPLIREEDIGTDTSNKFVDTFSFSNALLESIGGDYDGDQVTVKIAYSDEANEELRKFSESKKRYVSPGGYPTLDSSKEAIQALYNLTLTLPDHNLIDPIF